MHQPTLLVALLLLAGCSAIGGGEETLACDAGASVSTSPAAPSHREDVAFDVTGPEALATVWLLDGEPIEEPRHRFDAPGTHALEARLFTGDGCVAVGSLSLDVRNDAPQAHFSYAVSMDRLHLDARRSSDPNADELSYVWEVGGVGAGSGVEHLADVPPQGTVIKLVVSDPWGGEDRYQEQFAWG